VEGGGTGTEVFEMIVLEEVLTHECGATRLDSGEGEGRRLEKK